MEKIQRALTIWVGFGMTLTGVQTCGDYMFSGHTVVITLLNFFVTECEWNILAVSTLFMQIVAASLYLVGCR